VPTTSHVESSPAIWNGKAYVGAGNDGFYCVELEPRDGKPHVVWHLEGKDYPDCEACPVVVDGKVYFSLGLGGMAVVCADAETGKEIWRAKAPYPVFGNPTVVSNRVVIGMGNGNFVETAEQVRIKELGRLKERKAGPAELAAADRQLSQINGEVWCLDAQDGRLLWSNKVGRVVLGSIAHADGELYVGSCDGALSCFSMDGELLRSWNAHEPIKISPAVGKEHVYFLTDGGRLYALDRKDFRRPVWECRIGTSGLFISSPAVGGGHVYVGTAGSGFMCVGQPAGTRQETRWLGHLGGPGKSGWADKTPPANQGRFAWRHPPEQDEEVAATAAVARVSAPLAVGSNALFVAQHGARNGLLKLVPGPNRRRAPADAGFYATSNGIHLSPAVYDDRVYTVDGRSGDEGRKLHCLAADGMKPLWSREVAREASGESTLTAAGKMLIYDRPGQITLLDLGGEAAELWSAPVAAPRGAPCESRGLVLVASESDSCLYALSSVNGGVLWKAALMSPPRTGPVTDGELVVVGTAEGIAAVGIVDGRPQWSAACGAVSAPLVTDSGRIACVTAGGLFASYDWAGRELSRLEGALPGVAPLLCGDSILFFMPESIQRMDAASGKTAVWLPRTGWLGKASAPGVLAEGFLYYGSESKGVVCVGPR
jgi:outer membrane protein assembly factor BamB